MDQKHDKVLDNVDLFLLKVYTIKEITYLYHTYVL